MRKCGKFFKFLFLFFSVPGGPHLCSCHVSLGSSWLPKFSDASCFRWPWQFWGTLARYVPDCSLIGFVRYLSHNKSRIWVSWKQTMESHAVDHYHMKGTHHHDSSPPGLTLSARPSRVCLPKWKSTPTPHPDYPLWKAATIWGLNVMEGVFI